MWKPKRLFAQNFEDLYLYRLFSGVDKGFYIDVGAWHPTLDNVTAIFYEQGWRGINIEPVSEIFEILQKERAEDTNLCLAVVGSSETTSVPILIAGDNPLQSGQHCVSIELPSGQASSSEGGPPIPTRLVPAATLREIIDKYAMLQEICFLKLDIEGYEYQALLGLDLPTLRVECRPQVIVLEATLPDTRLSSPCRSKCRANLEENGYRYLYFDGLNDYYCEQSMHDVFAPLMLPPNVFDSPYVAPSRMFRALDEIEAESIKCLVASSRVSELEIQLSLKAALLETAEADNANLAASSKKLQDDVACLFEGRIALADKLKMLRQVIQSDISGPELSHECGSGLYIPPARGFGVRTDMNETVRSFRLAVYVHIPKSSGTSTLWAYLQNFEDRVKWHGINASLPDMLQGIPTDYSHPSALYCGHFYLSHIESSKAMFPDCAIKYFAHFRDPMERAISYYKHIARPESLSPEFSLVTNFQDDLRGWFGELLVRDSQVRFLSPSPSPGPVDIGELLDFMKNSGLRLFDNRNVVGCSSEINLHLGIYLPGNAHSHRYNVDPYPDLESSLSSLANISSLPLLREICQIDIDFWELVKSQGLLS